LHEASAIHLEDAREILRGKIVLMQRAKKRDAVMFGEPAQQVEHLTRHDRIERRDRLVGEYEQRLLHQRTRNGDALLLTAGQGAGASAQFVGKRNTLQRAVRFIKLGGARPKQKAQGVPIGPAAERPSHHVVIYAQAFNQIVLLRNHGDAPAQCAQISPIADIERAAVEHDGADCARMLPLIARSKVVLPAPLGPTSAARSPRASVNDTSRHAAAAEPGGTTRSFSTRNNGVCMAASRRLKTD
jgi:hypothetical protein